MHIYNVYVDYRHKELRALRLTDGPSRTLQLRAWNAEGTELELRGWKFSQRKSTIFRRRKDKILDQVNMESALCEEVFPVRRAISDVT